MPVRLPVGVTGMVGVKLGLAPVLGDRDGSGDVPGSRFHPLKARAWAESPMRLMLHPPAMYWPEGPVNCTTSHAKNIKKSCVSVSAKQCPLDEARGVRCTDQ